MGKTLVGNAFPYVETIPARVMKIAQVAPQTAAIVSRLAVTRLVMVAKLALTAR